MRIKKTIETDKTSKTSKDWGATTQHIYAQIILIYAVYIVETTTPKW